MKNIEELKSWFEGDKFYEGEYVNHKIDQLDDPEVLSSDWIDEHAVRKIDGKENPLIVYVDDLQNLLVPKQEVNLKIQGLIEKYEQEDGEHSNPENAWIDDFIYDLKSLIKKEQKYYVLDSEDIPLLERANNQTCKTTTGLSIYEDGRDNSRFALTEQEIKDYDERYWAFAEPIEEADFRLLF